MKVKTLAVEETGFMHVKNVHGELLHDGGKPVCITFYGPGTKIYANALAAKQNSIMERIRKREKDAPHTAADADADTADNVAFLVDVTKQFHHIEDDAPDGTPLTGADLFRSVYSSQPLGFIAEQGTRFLSSWANFKQASSTN